MQQFRHHRDLILQLTASISSSQQLLLTTGNSPESYQKVHCSRKLQSRENLLSARPKMYRYIIALAIAASSIPSGVAQIATQFQSPSIAFSSSDDCSNAGTASSMVAGSCTAIPKDLLTGSPSQGMNITYPIDNVDLNCPREWPPLCFFKERKENRKRRPGG